MVTQVQGTPDMLFFLLQHQALLCSFWRWQYVLGPHFLQEASEKDRLRSRSGEIAAEPGR